MKIIAVYDSLRPSGKKEKEILVWPDSAMIRSRKPLFLEEGRQYVHIGIAARIDAVGKSIRPKFAGRYYSELAPMAFILTEKVSDLLENGMDPAACDIVADYTLICGDFVTPERLENIEVSRSGGEVDTRIFRKETIDEAIAVASVRNTLKTGDIVAVIGLGRFQAQSDMILKISSDKNTLLENKLK